jgi:predicted amino acid dehydrogenase
MKHIVSISFSGEDFCFDKIFKFQGETFRLTHHSTNYDYKLTEKLILEHDGKCDVIALSGLPCDVKFQDSAFHHPSSYKLKHLTKETITVDGQLLKNIYLPFALKKYMMQTQYFLKSRKIGFYSGLFLGPVIEAFLDEDHRVELLDPYLFLKFPKTLRCKGEINRFVKLATPFFKRMKLKREHIHDIRKAQDNRFLKSFFESDIFYGNEAILNLIDLNHLQGKILLVDRLTPTLEEKLKKAGIQKVITTLPNIIESDFVNYAIVEAILQSFKPESEHLTIEDILKWNEEIKLDIREIDFQGGSLKPKKFAFIIHPLSASYLFKHPFVKPFEKILQPLEGMIEDLMSLVPGIYYGKIKGIKSELTGQEIEGLIYTVSETPKKLMEKNPEKVYKKLNRLCRSAHAHGAELIGLGAYTKIVGDAGVTVDRLSPIPVTTGNSLSATSTLWAAKFAIEKMGLVKQVNGKYKGKAMIIGATGSIGAVSAKVLADYWDEIILVAPRAYKLLELKEEIKKISPDCKVSIATKPEEFSHESDLIITTTSARGHKILDIERVKSGCVICDVSRPFDISEEDAMKRPDVMVIASGEVLLPGKVECKVDIGLEGNIVYACLAETALLTMAGRLESFTLSRNISYKKVLEIDKLAKEHGVYLASIMGHAGFVTDEEFKLCLEHVNLRKKDLGQDFKEQSLPPVIERQEKEIFVQ